MHLARGCVRLVLLRILYLYEGKRGGKKWIDISSNLQVIQHTQSCISELFLFQTKSVLVMLRERRVDYLISLCVQRVSWTIVYLDMTS